MQEARLLTKSASTNGRLFNETLLLGAAHAGQTDSLGHTSLAYEDKFLLKLRVERLKSPLAYSQNPPSRSHHLLQAPEFEKKASSKKEFVMRTPFIYTETRGDDSQRYAATARHTLVWKKDRLRIRPSGSIS